MKKVLLALLAAAVLQPGAFAYFGVGLKAGAGSSTDTDLKNHMDYAKDSAVSSYSGELTTNNLVYGAEMFFETAGEKRFGLSLGINGMGKNEMDVTVDGDNEKLEADALTVPVTLYWKYQPANRNWALKLGAGADYMRAKTTTKDSVATVDYTQSKIVPHVDAGAEWFISKSFSLGFDLAYLFGAKFDELKGSYNGVDYQLYTIPQSVGSAIAARTVKPAGSNAYVQDYTGIRGNIALRYYFGGASASN